MEAPSQAPSGRSVPPRFAAGTEARADRPTLRFMTCGSVDDGKSTLIGRLLYDSELLLDDQLDALRDDSKRHGTTGDRLDFALLVDGLQAEREQGITIEVAYRYFATGRRRFIVADSPGHEEYTRNMATAASNVELALVLVDARKGIVTQTRRHSHILALLGVRHVVLTINKMDLVGFDRARFAEIEADYLELAAQLGLRHVRCIPISALDGDNVTVRSARMPWYRGPTILQHLEDIDVPPPRRGAFRLPVQWVNRPNAEFRGYCGRVASGAVATGDAVTVYPSGRRSQIARIVTADGDLERAAAGQSVTLVLASEIDVSRGDVLSAGDPPIVSDSFAAHVIWFDDTPLVFGHHYVIQSASHRAGAVISTLQHRVAVDTLEKEAATLLGVNEVGYVHLSLDRAIACDPYEVNRELGGFLLVDPATNRTVAAGLIDFALRRATDIRWEELAVDKAVRARLKSQRPCVLWFTGLSGAGKSTVANLVEQRLAGLGRHTYLLDGDNIRHGLNRDLSFAPEARAESIRRVGEVARLMVDAGLFVLVSLISPFRGDRAAARSLMAPGEFIEIHVATSLEACEARDPKGLYRRARAGEIPAFTGIDSPYEAPENPEIRIDTGVLEAEHACDLVVAYLQERHYL